MEPPLAYQLLAGLAAGVATWVSAEILDALVGQPLVGFGIPLIAIATWYGGARAALTALATALVLLLAMTFEPRMQPWSDSDVGIALVGVLVLFTATDIVLHEIYLASRRTNTDLLTRQRELLNALLASDDRWRRLTDSAPALITQTRASDGAILFANDVARNYTGPVSNARDARLSAIGHPDDLARVYAEHERLVNEDIDTISYEWRIRRGDGSYRWHFGSTTKLLNERGELDSFVGMHIDIHDRKVAEQELAASESRWRTLTSAAPVMITQSDADGNLVFANEAFREYAGEVPVGRKERFAAVVHPDDLELKAARRVTANGEPASSYEFRLRRADGQYRWQLASTTRLLDNDGKPGTFINMYVDIHDRKVVEQALQASDERWRQLNAAIPALVALVTPKGEILFENDAYAAYIGKPFASLTLAERLSGFVHPDDTAAAREGAAKLLAGENEITWEWRARRHDGEYRWHLSHIIAIPGNGAQPDAWLSVSIDIHDRKVVEHALELSELRWRSLADATPAMIFETTEGGDFLYENKPFRDYTGRSFVGTKREERLPALVHPDDLETILRVIERLRLGDADIDFEWRPLRHDGVYCWHLGRATSMPGDETRWLVTSLDIDARKKAEERLLASEREFRALVESSPAFVFRGDATGALTYASPGFFDYIGSVATGGNQARAVAQVLHPDDVQRFIDTYARSHANESPADIEYRLRRHDGEYRWFLAQTSPVVDEDGHLTGWVGTAIDIHDRKVAQAELEQALLAKDEFLGMVSHELRTPITTIMGNAEVLLRRRELIDEVTRFDAMTDIHDDAIRLKKIIDNLLALARLEQSEGHEVEPLLLRRVIEQVCASEEREHGKRNYQINIPDVLVSGNEVYLGQVVRNLLSNAAKYSPPGSPVTITGAERGGMVEVSIRDRGLGLDEADAVKIFDPFYRAERTINLQGIGIGLAVCKRLIQTMGGDIRAQTPADGEPGTEFVFTLPIYVE